KPVERDWLVEGFFGLLTGKFERARNASEVRISDLTRAIAELGHWKSTDAWEPPDPAKVRVLVAEGDGRIAAPTVEKPAPAPVVVKVEPKLEAPKPEPRPEVHLVEPGDLPPDAITLERGRTHEETFVSRFEAAFEVRTHVPS